MAQPNGIIRVCALVPYPLNTTPSQRFRIEQWNPYLQAEGITMDFFPFVDDGFMKILYKADHHFRKAFSLVKAFARKVIQLPGVRQYDAVLVHRGVCIAGAAWFERMITAMRRPLIYDFDDAIYRLHTSEANRWFGWLKFPGKTAAICRMGTHITVGNAYLADYARQYNSNITIIPTSVDTDLYKPLERSHAQSPVVLGWTGSSTSQTHLELFAPMLRDLLERRNVELRVISNREPVLPGIPHTWRAWSPETEIKEIGEFDIGIMPLPDDPWARGKCALKALQYMSMAVPAVCSPVGANMEVIQHGENGLLAATTEDWLTQLSALIDNPELRRRLGEAGRKTVEQKYSMKSSAALLGQVIRNVVAASKASAKVQRQGQPMNEKT